MQTLLLAGYLERAAKNTNTDIMQLFVFPSISYIIFLIINQFSYS
jgi:hypothetical protein